MTLESVVQAILESGKAEADLILEEAHLERQRMLSEVREEGAKVFADAESRSREGAARRPVQEVARGELDSRKIILAAQKDALDEAYRRTLGRLGDARGDDTVLRNLLKANEAEWRAGRVFASPKDEAAIRRIVGDRYAGNIECTGGVVIEATDGTHRLDLRYESLLREVWDESVKEVADILWPSKPSKK